MVSSLHQAFLIKSIFVKRADILVFSLLPDVFHYSMKSKHSFSKSRTYLICYSVRRGIIFTSLCDFILFSVSSASSALISFGRIEKEHCPPPLPLSSSVLINPLARSVVVVTATSSDGTFYDGAILQFVRSRSHRKSRFPPSR